MLSSCIFCKIIAKQIPSTVIAENDQMIIIKDINPKAPQHYLIIPKKHLADLSEFQSGDENIAAAMLMMAKELGQKIGGSKAFRLMMNNGSEVGQSVFHAHMHFLAGKKMSDF